MTRVDVAALRALLDKATPGSWLRCEPGVGWTTLQVEEGEGEDAYLANVVEAREADAQLIAAMHAALPALLDRMERLERVVAKVAKKPHEDNEGYCFGCGGQNCDDDEHASDCAWVEARALTKEET